MRNFKTVVIKEQKVENQRPEPQTETNQIQDSSQGYENVQDIAEYLAIKPSTLYALVGRREVPFYKVGRLIRFKRSSIDEWMEKQREEVVDIKMEAKKVLRSIEKKSDLDLDRIMKKVVEQSKKKRYNSPQEKPGGIEGLETEVNHGTV